MTDRNLDLPPDTEARLDLLVAEWVEHRGLSTARTEQLRRVVLAMHEPDAAPPAVAGSPLDQGPEWWSSLFTPLLTTLSQAATSGYQSVWAAGEACLSASIPETCYLLPAVRKVFRTPLSQVPQGPASRSPPSFLPEPDLRGQPVSVEVQIVGVCLDESAHVDGLWHRGVVVALQFFQVVSADPGSLFGLLQRYSAVQSRSLEERAYAWSLGFLRVASV